MGQIALKAVARTRSSEVLPLGVISFDEMTGIYKIGDGVTVLSELPEFGAISGDVASAIADLVDGAPGALNTLNELSAALGDDSNFATTILNDLAGKQNVGNYLTASDVGTAAAANTGTGATNVPTITQADLRYLRKTGSLFDIRDYGYISGGDATAAVTAAISALVATGKFGGIWLPEVVDCATGLDFTACAKGFALCGPVGARNVNGAPFGIRYTGTNNPARFIDARGLSGCYISGYYTYTSATFTGILLDFAGLTGVADGSLHNFDNAVIRQSAGIDSHAALLNIDRCHSIDLNHCIFIGSKALKGKSTNASYSNRVTVQGGFMQGLANEPIWNPGMAWTFIGVTFEPLTGSLAGAANNDAGVQSDGVVYSGCYFGDDSTVTAGQWIKHEGANLVVRGGIISVQVAGSALVKVTGTSSGPVVVGDATTHIATTGFMVDVTAATTPRPVFVFPCAYSNFPTNLINGTVPYGSELSKPNAGFSRYRNAGFNELIIADVAGRVVQTLQVLGESAGRMWIEPQGILIGNGTTSPDAGFLRSTQGALVIQKALAQQRAVQTLAANGAVTIDASLANRHTITLQANATSSTITNGSTGQKMTIAWQQDATGGRTYVWPATCKFAGSAAPSDTTASKLTSVTFVFDATNWIEESRSVAVG